jgi:hypothetical protein
MPYKEDMTINLMSAKKTGSPQDCLFLSLCFFYREAV